MNWEKGDHLPSKAQAIVKQLLTKSFSYIGIADDITDENTVEFEHGDWLIQVSESYSYENAPIEQGFYENEYYPGFIQVIWIETLDCWQFDFTPETEMKFDTAITYTQNLINKAQQNYEIHPNQLTIQGIK